MTTKADIKLIAPNQANSMCLELFNSKIDEPAKQWNAMQALSKSSLFRNDSMPDLILTIVRPCVKCGGCERYANGQCKACSIAAAAAWRRANPDRPKANAAAWRAANPERHRASIAAWQAANPERAKAIDSKWKSENKARIKANDAANYLANTDREKATVRAWQAANPEAVRVISQNRRARKQASTGKLSKGLAEKLFVLQKGLCPCCGKPLGNDYHLDHTVPLALGGSNTDDNIQLLRKRCNQQKHAADPVDFMQSRGFLL